MYAWTSLPLWVYFNVGILVAYLSAHSVVYYRYRCRESADSTEDCCPPLRETVRRDPGTLNETETVTCPLCGIENRQGFRYCRACTGTMGT